jgi:MerR family transcriptional regulator, light-induced transcriptional regulator
MATVLGIAALRSRLGDWRASRRTSEPTRAEPMRAEMIERPAHPFELVNNNDDDRNISLFLENLVIPRLIADRDKPACGAVIADAPDGMAPQQAISAADVEAFAQLSLSAEATVLIDFVDAWLARGCSVETVYVELLAPAARRLGAYWEEDSEDFVGVTMGLWRIQEILREMTVRMPPPLRAGQGQRSALFSSMPGEQHSFGTLMIAECFERAGWNSDVLIEPSQSELTAQFARHHYDLIGLTVSCDCPTATLTSLIMAIRSVSSNPDIRVMIGGRVINERPELVGLCGADATASDAPSAVAVGDRLVPLRSECFERLS